MGEYVPRKCPRCLLFLADIRFGYHPLGAAGVVQQMHVLGDFWRCFGACQRIDRRFVFRVAIIGGGNHWAIMIIVEGLNKQRPRL